MEGINKKKHIIVLCLISIIFATFFQVCFGAESNITNKEYKYPDIYWWERDKRGREYIVEHYAVREITQATNIKVISGYPDGTFRPFDSISREEFIKMLMALSTNRTFDFASVDTKYNSWAGPYVTIAEMQGIIE